MLIFIYIFEDITFRGLFFKQNTWHFVSDLQWRGESIQISSLQTRLNIDTPLQCKSDTNYHLFCKYNIHYIIIKLTYSHSNSKIKKLWLTSQDTNPLLNKVTRAPSDILIGQTHSANSSHGLPKYLMIHSPFCSINVTHPVLMLC